MPTPTNKGDMSCVEPGRGRPSFPVKGIFAPQYFGSVYYYAAMAVCSEAIIDTGLRYDKRFKSIHRCTVADTRGPLTLTVPVSKPNKGQDTVCSSPQWRQWTVSSHGQWWADHRVSLESGYGRTPYFEFYIDRLLPWLSDRNDSVFDFDCTLDAVIRRTLGITTDVRYMDLSTMSPSSNTSRILENSREFSKVFDSLDRDLSDYTDYRQNRFEGIVDVPYWQVRADRLGFLPGLSILDLMFNMGPEAILVLHRMYKK